MRTKCYSVHIKSICDISDKAVKIEDFNGNSAIIPVSQIFDEKDTGKSIIVWVAAWILEKKGLTYSRKNVAVYNDYTQKIEPYIIVEKIRPEKVEYTKSIPDDSLIR